MVATASLAREAKDLPWIAAAQKHDADGRGCPRMNADNRSHASRLDGGPSGRAQSSVRKWDVKVASSRQFCSIRVDVLDLPFLQQLTRREQSDRGVSRRSAPRLRSGARTPLGDLHALRPVEPLAARGALGGDRRVRA